MVIWMVRTTLNKSRRCYAVKLTADALMDGRMSLSAAEFAEKHFPASQEVAARLLGILSNELIVDVSRIHPTDRLFADLGLGAVDAMDSVFVAMDVEEAFNADIAGLLQIDSVTIADIVSHIQLHKTNGG